MSVPDSTTLRGPVYGRVSKDENERSIPEQLEWADSACAHEGVTITAQFSDDGISGHDNDREGLLAMIEHCEGLQRARQPANVVTCWLHNRLSRSDSLDSNEHLRRLRKAGIRWIFTSSRWFDLFEPGDLTILHVEQNHSNYKYSVDLAHVATRGKIGNARAGLWNGGRVPYGYALTFRLNDRGRSVPDKLVTDPLTAPVVRRLFGSYAGGRYSLRMLADDLNARREATPSMRAGWPNAARLWSAQTVRGILTSAVYLGSLVWNRTHQGRFLGVVDGKMVPMPAKLIEKRKSAASPTSGQKRRRRETTTSRNAPADVIRGEAKHDALTTPETFELCQRRLIEQRRSTTPVRGGGGLTLTGLVWCGHCGRRMIGRHSRGRARYLCGTYLMHGKTYCNYNSVTQEALQGTILAKLQARFTPEFFAEARVLLAERLPVDPAADVGRLRSQLAETERQRSRAIRRAVMEEDDAVARMYRDEAKALDDNYQCLEARIAVAEEAGRDQPDPSAVIDEAVAIMAALGSAGDTATPAELRAILRDHVEKIELFFEHEADGRQTRCSFARGELWLRESSPLCYMVVKTSQDTLTSGNPIHFA